MTDSWVIWPNNASTMVRQRVPELENEDPAATIMLDWWYHCQFFGRHNKYRHSCYQKKSPGKTLPKNVTGRI